VGEALRAADARVKEYCYWKWENFWEHPQSKRNVADVKDLYWVSKDLDGLDSADARWLRNNSEFVEIEAKF